MEEVPIIALDEGGEEDVTVFIDLEEPSRESILKLYKTYREGGGEPYEPYESMLRESESGQSENGSEN